MAAKEKRWSLQEEVCGNSDGREKVVNKVPLYMQTYSWDCGLACASMVLQYLGKSSKKVYTSDLEELKCGESIWTIDLALLMKLHNIRHLLCTITFGVDQGYSKQAFYSNFVTDEERVSNLFQNAESMGINVQKRSVHCDEIVSHLEDGNLAIILVDWAQLECLWCDKRHCKSCCFSCLSSSCCRGYQGHFIVACGFDSKKKKIFYMNPSYDEELCCCRMSQFDAARKSYGTDEDILFIYKDGVP